MTCQKSLGSPGWGMLKFLWEDLEFLSLSPPGSIYSENSSIRMIPSVTFILWYCLSFTQIKCFLARTGPLVTCGKQEEGSVNSLRNNQSYPCHQIYRVLDHMSVSAVEPGLGVSGLLVTSEFMCLEAYGLDIWSQSKGARYFKLATILLTLTGFLCSHSNMLDEKFLMFQTIPSSGLHFIIQSPAKQLQCFCVTVWPWG